MPHLNVALLQLEAHGNDQAANLAEGERACREAARMGADIALFPEMWNIGYTPYSEDVWLMDFDPADPAYADQQAAWQAQAIDAESSFVQHFRALAAELDMAIVLTYLEAWPGAPRNTAAVIDRHGEIVLTYAKVHTCDWSLEAACTPGGGFPVAALDTRIGAVQIGVMICFDREFPESARLLMLHGAELVLVPNACPIDMNRQAQLRTRAYENMVAVAMANYAGMGHSAAYDGIAYGADGQPNDMLVIEAGTAAGVYLARFDLDALRDYRQRESWGNAYRKPGRYADLVDPVADAPFKRKHARR